MKTTIHNPKQELTLSTSSMAIVGLQEQTKLHAHLGEGVMVITKAEMNAREMIAAIQHCKEVAAYLTADLASACGDCDGCSCHGDCENCASGLPTVCPGCGCLLIGEACESDTTKCEHLDFSKHFAGIRDAEQILEMLEQCDVCTGALYDLLESGEIVYD